MNTQNNRYLDRGVSHQKEDVHKAIQIADRKSKMKKDSNNPFSNAFCKAIENPFSNDTDSLFLLHADGAGTKTALAYLYWKEMGDLNAFKGIAQDSLVMNTDDMLCVGATDNFIFSSTIDRNKHLIPGEVISTLIEANEEFVNLLNENGIRARMLGGETGDMGDLIQTIVVNATATTIIDKSQFIQTQNIQPNSVIVGLASFGKSRYENEYNSGIGSNGLTSARHDILKSIYKKYPETFSKITEELNPDLIYGGDFLLSDPLSETPINIGQALLSPTRTYLPVVREILKECSSQIDAIIHCTGGGQTKCLKFGQNIHFIKNNLFHLPPLFKLLKEKTTYEEFFQVFNAGHRLEIYTNEKMAETIIDISKSFAIDAQIIGYTDHSNQKNKLTISYRDEEKIWTHTY